MFLFYGPLPWIICAFVQKKGELELIRAKNMKILFKNILCKEFDDLVQKYNKWRAPFALFLLLLL